MPGPSAALRVYAYVFACLVALPIAITLPVAITTTGYMTFPPVGFTLKWFGEAFYDGVLVQALSRSVTLAAVSAALAVIFGALAAFAVERRAFRGRAAVETFFAGPKMVPQIILVLALLIFFEAVGLAETFTALVIAHLLLALPYAFRTLLASVAGLDKRLEWSAEILGAGRAQVFWRVILPQMKTGMFAALLFTFMVSFTNVTMALFLAGVGRKTLPVEMFHRLQIGGISPAIPALAFMLAVAGLAVFIAADRTVGVYKYLGGGGSGH